MLDGVLRARVAARAVDGAANQALIRLIAESLGVAKTRVTIRSGANGRSKVVDLEGLSPDRLRSLWPGLDV